MNKFKIKKGREKLSDQDIEQHMNFDTFMSGHTPIKSWMPKGIALNTLIVSVATILIIAGYLIYHSGKNENASVTPFIDPPVKVLDLPTENFTLNNDQDTTIIYKTGTLVHIPSGAFVDKDGKDVKGAIEIRYREFHDPIDIMLSGIPMTYDSAGNHYDLESAGMFEVMAYQNDRPLYLKPGKELSVNMVSHTNNANDYNIYYLDTVKRKWNYISENTEKNKTCVSLFDKNPAYEKEFKSADDFIKSNKPVLPKKETSGAYNFVIDFKKDEFPELAVYNGLKFEPIERKKEAHSKLAQKTWENVLIERGEDNEHYVVTFSSEKESHSINVVPVVDEKNYAKSINEYKKRQLLYESMLADKKKYLKEKKDSLYKINAIYSGMASRSNLNERFSNFVDGNFMPTSKDLLAYRIFKVSSLGVWNSDKPFMAATRFFAAPAQNNISGKQVDYKALFLSQNNEPLILRQAFLVRRNVNSIYSLPLSEQTLNHFTFRKGSPIDMIVVVGQNNELFYIKDQELKEVEPDKGTIYFKMNRVPDNITNATQLKEMLKI